MTSDQITFCCNLLKRSVDHEQVVNASSALNLHIRLVAARESQAFDDMARCFIFMCVALSMVFCSLSFWLIEAFSAVCLFCSVRVLVGLIRARRSADPSLESAVASAVSVFTTSTDEIIADAEKKFKAATSCLFQSDAEGYVLQLDTGDEFRISRTPEIIDLIAEKALAFSSPPSDTRVSAATRLDGMRRIHPQLLA